MADIRSRPSTDTYRENWDRIFGKPLPKRDSTWGLHRPDWFGYPRLYESYDSHPAAD